METQKRKRQFPCKVSPWIDGSVRPVRRGVYQRDWQGHSHNVWFSYWSGSDWRCMVNDLHGAKRMRDIPSRHQALPWRGLASKP